MRIYVGITDYNWYLVHSSNDHIEEVNFWRSSDRSNFVALQPGGLFLFKLHHPRNFIVGGGFFVKFLKIPISLAWRVFGEGNGAYSLDEVRNRVGQYRRQPLNESEDPIIGCILIDEPFFFPEKEWIPAPANFSGNIVQGKGYSTDEEYGRRLWYEVSFRLEGRAATGPATAAIVDAPRYGEPVLVRPRLGQGSFRLLIRDTYNYRCAFTGEKTLPVLDAAHIRPYSQGGDHELANGFLLKSDIHTLFDLGYIGVDPDERKIIVSSRIREEFENGRDYYALHGKDIIQPNELISVPNMANLVYHRESIFLK
jgi:putative restriction endonuclease